MYTRYCYFTGKEIWKYGKAMEVQPRSNNVNAMDHITILFFLLYLQLSCDTKERREALELSVTVVPTQVGLNGCTRSL